MITLTAPPSPTTPPTLVTADEFTANYGHLHAELVAGVVKEYPVPTSKHGYICLLIGRLLGNHVEAHDLGRVMSNDSWVKTSSNPDTVLGADICYFSYERLPRGPMPEGLLPVAPELVVEVRSPSDRWMDIFGKMTEYLRAGVSVVVILDTKTETASVYRTDELQRILHNSDVLTIDDLLPGFAVVVSRLFA